MYMNENTFKLSASNAVYEEYEIPVSWEIRFTRADGTQILKVFRNEESLTHACVGVPREDFLKALLHKKNICTSEGVIFEFSNCEVIYLEPLLETEPFRRQKKFAISYTYHEKINDN